MAAVAEGLARRARLVELDQDIAAVWQAMLGPDTYQLALKVGNLDPTYETVRRVLDSEPRTTLQRAFRILVRNRVSFRGVMTAHAGLTRQGRDETGFRQMWNGERLAERILAIHSLRDRLEFEHGDGLAALERYANDRRTAVFADPPYTDEDAVLASQFYRHHVINHERLFELAAGTAGPTLLTYDPSPTVLSLAARHGLDARTLTVYTAQLQYKRELLIGRDLSWLKLAHHVIKPATPRQLRRRTVASADAGSLPDSMSGTPSGYVPVAEAARELGVTRRTVERMVASRQLERRINAKRAFISEPSLRAALAKRAAKEPAPSKAELSAVLLGIEKLLAELREDRRLLVQALTERDEARLEAAELRARLQELSESPLAA